MSLYTTPLQIGYFMGLLFTLLFLWRGKKEGRLSDSLMGALMLIMTLEIQDYTFGFAGINYLWTTLNGFPRGVSLLFGPAIYFYLLSQTDSGFRLNRSHLLHLLPFALFFLIDLSFFIQGPAAVQHYQSSRFKTVIDLIGTAVLWASYVFYFYKSFRLYRTHRRWLLHVHSDPDSMNLSWFRNFLVILAIAAAFTEAMGLMDYFLDWSFYEDWWWNLWLVGVIILTGIRAYAQPQLVQIDPRHLPNAKSGETDAKSGETDAKSGSENTELKRLMDRIDVAVENDKRYLQTDLNLRLLAEALHMPASDVSRAINQVKGMNFNDYINAFRVEEFKRRALLPESRKLTLLALAHDSGFNSKATFNRVFARREGTSPGTWLADQKPGG